MFFSIMFTIYFVNTFFALVTISFSEFFKFINYALNLTLPAGAILYTIWS